MRDPYSILGVKPGADPDEIKAAWRSKAKVMHPDHNQDDPTATGRFAEVGQAYDLLKDPDRRRRYDAALEKQQTILQQRQAAREAAERAKAAKANAEKIMEELARANAARAQQRAKDARRKSANDAAESADSSAETAEDMVERIFGDPSSQPSGRDRADNGFSSPETEAPEQTPSDPASRAPLPAKAVELIAALLRKFRGAASAPEKAPDLPVDAVVTIRDLLAQAWVTVQVEEDRDVRFPIEKGMSDGHVLRLKGQGMKIPGMKQGDLLVTIRVAREAALRAEGHDLHATLPISLEDAVLGSDAAVETPEGVHTLTVPAWCGSDQSVRLPGLGLYRQDGTRGDLVAELRILLWDKPDEKVTDLMRHMKHGLYL